MKFSKTITVFSVFLMLQPWFSVAEGESSLENEDQEDLCMSRINNKESYNICVEDKVDLSRVLVCEEYTWTAVSEALCLKNRRLSSEKVYACYVDTTELMEQICLVGSDTSNSIIDHFRATEQDMPDILEKIHTIAEEMKTILDKKVVYSYTEGEFIFTELPEHFKYLTDLKLFGPGGEEAGKLQKTHTRRVYSMKILQ